MKPSEEPIQQNSTSTEEAIIEISNQESAIQAETVSEQNNNIPLDIKELKAIADLVKQLQIRSQQRQSE